MGKSSTKRSPVKCQLCKKEAAVWAMQYVAERHPSFYTLGSHIRGFKVTKVCETCRKIKRHSTLREDDNPPTEKEFIVKVMHAIVLCVADADYYSHFMDDLSCELTDTQWERLCSFLDLADDWLGDTEKATLRQRERLKARLEGRESEYPNIFSLTLRDPDSLAKLLELEKKHGIPAPTHFFAKDEVRP